MMKFFVRTFFGFVVFAMIVGTPIVYAIKRDVHIRNFRVVQDGVLYRSGQLSLTALDRVVHDYGIKTVVSLRLVARSANEPPESVMPDAAEEDYCRKNGLNFIRIHPDVWVANSDGNIPGEAAVNEFLEVIKDKKNQPVLIHCFRGVHRTGTFCSIFRMECQGWSNADAIEEMKLLGYTNFENEDDIRNYLTNYKPAKDRIRSK